MKVGDKNIQLIGKREYIDRPFWILFTILLVVAVIALFSAGSTLAYNAEHSALSPILKQVFFLLLGVGMAYFVQLLPTWLVRLAGYVLLGISLLCMYIMLIPGNPFVVMINGAGRWFNLFGIQFQPSELAKLSLIITIADLLARVRTEQDAKRYFYITLALTVLTCFPIMTGNLSTAMLLAIIVFFMWVLARLPWRYILLTVGIVFALLLSGYLFVEKVYIEQGKTIEHGPFKRAMTWVKRIDDMRLEHTQDAATFELNDDNYQRTIAKVAVARGGKSPFGVLPGNSKERDYLPLAYADYIFAIIVEETGVIGAAFLMFLYLAILCRACYASAKYADYSAMLMVMGLALMLTVQALISMAVAVGIGPVTGQPLPLISKGGTSAIITSMYFGVMMCVAREQNELSANQTNTRNESYQNIPEINIEGPVI